MAAAAIMGILVSLALPRYRLFVARSRMAEAKANLGILATLQQSYYAEYQTNATIGSSPPVGGGAGITDSCNTDCQSKPGIGECNELGFRPTNCMKMRYFYTSGAPSSAANANLHVSSTNKLMKSTLAVLIRLQ